MDKTMEKIMFSVFMSEIIEHSKAVIDVKVDNGICTSNVTGNLTGMILACAGIVYSSCKKANTNPKVVLEEVGELIDIMDRQKI